MHIHADKGAFEDISTGQGVCAKAVAQLKAGLWEDSLEAFADAVEADPHNPDLRYYCGYVLEMLGQKEAALAQYQAALAIAPQHVNTLFQLALEADRQGLAEDGITLYQELLAVVPDHTAARFHLGCAYEKQGRAADALAQFQSLLELEPAHQEASQKVTFLRGMVAERTPPGDQALDIVFLWGGLPFDGHTLKQKPRGGTETGMIHMAHALANLGHNVRVFVNGGRGIFDGVLYADLNGYEAQLKMRPADVLVAARIFHPFLTALPAGVRVFWTGDAHDQPFVEFLGRPEVVAQIDRIFCVSRWQAQMLARQFGLETGKFYLTCNGVLWDHFKTPIPERDHHKLIYTSTPFRGLDVLLDLFGRIKARVPSATLDIYSSMALYQMAPDQDQATYGHLYKRAAQDGITLKGSVVQTELAEALLKAGVWAYPNHFAETSCIAAMEAMAAGLPVVTTALGALPETVTDGGILLEGDARSPDFQQRFVDAVCEVMLDRALWRRLSRAGRTHIKAHNIWSRIAAQWVREFERMLRYSAKNKL